jgi:hypothetical protein
MVEFIKNGQLIVENINQLNNYVERVITAKIAFLIECKLEGVKTLKSSIKLEQIFIEKMGLEKYSVNCYIQKMNLGKSIFHTAVLNTSVLFKIQYYGTYRNFKPHMIQFLDDFLLLTLTNPHFAIFNEFDLKIIIE